MYHTSPTPITPGTINKFGIAGDCLFFSDDIYVMTASVTVYVYQAAFDCVDASQLYDAEIVAEIAEEFDCDTDTAQRLLDARCNAFDVADEDAGEKDWWLQGKRGECAVKLGFDGCEDQDEQGAVYIIPMFGRESQLKLVNVA